MNEVTDTSSDATEGGEMTLTSEDIKQIGLALVSRLTHHPDVRAFLDQRIRQALADAGVLTGGNIHESAGLYARFQESTYEQVWKVLEEAGLAHRKG